MPGPIDSDSTLNVPIVGEPISHDKQDSQAVREVRKLVIDICRQNGGGHGGSAIGMAPMAVALWKHIMRYNPSNPEASIDNTRIASNESADSNNDSGLTVIGLSCRMDTLRCSNTPCSTLPVTHT